MARDDPDHGATEATTPTDDADETGLLVLKLGGSVITEKDEPETVDRGALEACASALGDYEGDAVVVHGGGSFGHYHAERHGVTEETGTRNASALLDVHDAMGQLNDRVIAALRAHDVATAPVEPFSLAHRDRDGALTMPVGGLETLIAEGFVPVLHGDGVPHRGTGVTVLSGDEVVVELARSLGAQRVGLCSTVEGVYDASGNVIDRIDEFDAVAEPLGASEATDVTGGMAGKVRTLLSLSTPARVFGIEDLAAFLRGDAVGTLVEGDR